MVDIKPFREVKDGELVTHYHPGQVRVDKSKARITFMLGSPQVGKTCYGSHWLYDRIQESAVTGEDNDYLAVTATFDLFKLKMLPELRKVFEGGVEGGTPYRVNVGRYWAGIKVIELAEGLRSNAFWAKTQDDKMWGRIILRSADSKSGLESSTVKAAWVDEPGLKDFTREAWEGVKRRLLLSVGPILGTSTIYNINWMKTEIFDPFKKGDPEVNVISVDALENPIFPKTQYESEKKKLPAWKFKMLYQGIYENPAGLIYDSFDQDNNIIDRFPLPKEWLVYVGHDFGGSNPAAMFYAQDPGTGYFYAFKSYKPNESKTVAEQVDEFKKVTQGYSVIKRAGGSHQEVGWRGDYTAHGWMVQEPKYSNSVEVGIEKVYALHKLNKIFVFRDMYDYLDEKTSYSRELDDDYNPTDKIADKAKFHLMDSERSILSDFTPETVVGGNFFPSGKSMRRMAAIRR